MYKSIGKFQYSLDDDFKDKLILEVDKDIYFYYRNLIPKHIKLNYQKFSPHISVIRKENVLDQLLLKSFHGLEVHFEYDNFIHNDDTYYWLNAYSNDLILLRNKLNLPDYSELCKPPDGTNCFHITIGNTKALK